jgi:RNA polymerase sigma factor (sigma-70 family)
MDINENEIVKYIEPVFHFCVKRLNNRQDAEDLTGEIMVHILSGIKKYHIDSLENWVWRIAHNRYARFIDMRGKHNEIPSEDDFTNIQDDYDFIDEMVIVDEYQTVFKYLHTLSSEYRNILVDYYIGQLPVKQIARNYGLTETTVKWRLNISRERIKTRIGEDKMDKVYKRINWNTKGCNGFVDSNKYLYSQTARAICEAAYEKPLTIEEISLRTGICTLRMNCQDLYTATL